MTQQRYHLVLEPIAGDVPDVIRLRGLLKRLLREAKMRCVKAYAEDIAGAVPSELVAAEPSGQKEADR